MQVRREDLVRAEDQRETDQHEQQLRREVDDREEDVQACRLADADDVQQHEHRDHDRAADDVPGVRPQRAPEDREVVRHEERRDGDRDHIIEHLRPRGPEGDELVEGMAGEAGGAAGLGKTHRPLGIGRRRRREDQSADHKDERRQPERDPSDQAEGVVDRGADVPVGGREERRRAEDALETLLTTPPRHARMLLPAAATYLTGLILF